MSEKRAKEQRRQENAERFRIRVALMQAFFVEYAQYLPSKRTDKELRSLLEQLVEDIQAIGDEHAGNFAEAAAAQPSPQIVIPFPEDPGT